MRHAFLFISSLGAGGAERAISELANWLVGDGWHVTLATLTDITDRDCYPLVQDVRRLHIGKGEAPTKFRHKIFANARRIFSLRKLFIEYSPTVIVSFIETNNILAICAAAKLGIPVIVAERTDPSQHLINVRWIWRWARRRFYKKASAVVAQTRAAADWLAGECGCQIEVIPNALRVLPEPIKFKEPWIVSAGRLEHVKGYDVILEAFACVAHDLPSWRLVIAGKGDLLDALQDKAHQLGIASRVDWLGYCDNIEVVLGRASIVALASRYEGFPNILLEALGMGAAVVVTDCRSGPSEMVEHEKNGLLVPVDDVIALADGIRRLAADQRLRNQLGVRALTVRSVYDQPTVMMLWSNLFNLAMERA